MRLLELVKQAGVGAVEAGNPVSMLYGTVIQGSPLQVKVDQRITLTEEFLIVPQQLTAYEVTLEGVPGYEDKPLVIRNGLAEGDKVLLLRVQGGQQFVILDRVVSA